MSHTVTQQPRLRVTKSLIDRRGDGSAKRTNETDLPFSKAVTMPKAELGSARVGLARTFNLGDYESLRLEVSIELPTPVDEIEAAVDRAKELAKQKLMQMASEAFGGDDG